MTWKVEAEVSNRRPIQLLDTPNARSELFYRDFFDVPRSTKPPKKTSVPPKSSKVRFHEQVKVKKIKAVGRGKPVSSMDDDSDSDEAEEQGGSDQGPGLEDLEEEDDEEEGEEEMALGAEDSDDMEDDSNDEADEEGDDGADWFTIERLEDDLFAEDQEEARKGEQ